MNLLNSSPGSPPPPGEREGAKVNKNNPPLYFVKRGKKGLSSLIIS